jgi:hypothetical protein
MIQSTGKHMRLFWILLLIALEMTRKLMWIEIKFTK